VRVDAGLRLATPTGVREPTTKEIRMLLRKRFLSLAAVGALAVMGVACDDDTDTTDPADTTVEDGTMDDTLEDDTLEDDTLEEEEGAEG
jgi:hypothetical protein